VYYNGFLLRVFQANAIASQAEKRQRIFDKTVDEWKRKVADLQAELDNAHAESRGSAAEVYRLKSQLEEYSDNIEALRRENKNLSGMHPSRVFLLRGTIASCRRSECFSCVALVSILICGVSRIALIKCKDEIDM